MAHIPYFSPGSRLAPNYAWRETASRAPEPGPGPPFAFVRYFWGKLKRMRGPNKGEMFECAMCHKTREATVDDAEALAEYQDLFTAPERAFDSEPPAVVCDDCWHKLGFDN